MFIVILGREIVYAVLDSLHWVVFLWIYHQSLSSNTFHLKFAMGEDRGRVVVMGQPGTLYGRQKHTPWRFFFPGTSFLFSEWHKKMLSSQTQKKLFMMKTSSTSSARQTHENPKTFLKTSADDHLAEGHLVLCLTSKTTDNSMPYTTLSILPTNHSSLEAGQQAG